MIQQIEQLMLSRAEQREQKAREDYNKIFYSYPSGVTPARPKTQVMMYSEDRFDTMDSFSDFCQKYKSLSHNNVKRSYLTGARCWCGEWEQYVKFTDAPII